MLKAAEGGLDFGVGCELAALGLSKTLQHGRKVRGIDFVGSPSLPLRLSMARAI